MFHNSVQHNVTRGLLEKRKFIICQYQYTIQVNLRYPICYDDHDIICSLKKQGKKLQGKFKILMGYACVIAVIEGPVGLTHRSHNVSSFEALITGFHFSQNVYTALKYSFGPIQAQNY